MAGSVERLGGIGAVRVAWEGEAEAERRRGSGEGERVRRHSPGPAREARKERQSKKEQPENDMEGNRVESGKEGWALLLLAPARQLRLCCPVPTDLVTSTGGGCVCSGRQVAILAVGEDP